MLRRQLIVASGSLMLAGRGAAQPAWPDRAVTIVAADGPGSADDVIARLAAPILSVRWGQPVVVQNVVGAAGTLGVERVVRAAPDGHTILLTGSTPIVTRVSMSPPPPYDPQRDLAPIMLLGITPIILLVSSLSPYRSIADIIAAARAQPGAITFAHIGTGSWQHIGAEMLAQMAGVQFTGIPYTQGAALVADVRTGRVAMAMLGGVLALPPVREGNFRALGVSSAARFAALPEVPTIAEQGFPDFAGSPWFGLYAPARTPAPIIARINADMSAAMDDAELRSRVALLGVQPATGTPEQLAQTIAAEIPRVRALLRAVGIQGG